MRWKASQSLIRIATILPGMLRWSRQRVVPPVGVLHPSVEGRRPRSAVPHVVLLHGIVGVDPAPIKPTGHHVRPVVAGMVASLCPWGPQRVGARPLLDIGQAVEPGLSPGFLDRSHLDAIVQTVPWSHNPRLLQRPVLPHRKVCRIFSIGKWLLVGLEVLIGLVVGLGRALVGSRRFFWCSRRSNEQWLFRRSLFAPRLKVSQV